MKVLERRGWAGGVVAGVLAVAALGAVVAAAYFSMRGLGATTRALSTERLRWDPSGGPPRPFAGGPGRPEMAIGRCRGEAADELFVVVIDPATGAERGRAGPFGAYGEGDASPLEACALPATRRAFVHVANRAGGDVEVDLDTGAVSPSTASARPATCGRAPGARESPATAPHVEGFDARRVLVDGDADAGVAVVAGVRMPGAALPAAVGFDRGTRAARWSVATAAVGADEVDPAAAFFLGAAADALGGGRYVSVYGVRSRGYRLTALDAKTGARAWDVPLPRLEGDERPRDVVATASFVYVARATSLEIFDAASGKAAGTFGVERETAGVRP